MTLNSKHNIFQKVVFSFIVLASFTASFMLQSCGENDTSEDNKAVVVLTCKSIYSDTSTKQDSSVTRAITSVSEGEIHDITVYIFDSNGDVIGSQYTAGNITNTVTASITTRAASGCTIYVVANAGSGKFAGIYNKNDFDKEYTTITNPDDLANGSSTYPIMFGKIGPITISAGTSTQKIDVARLLSKITFKIVPNSTKDPTHPITIDGYQLHHVPLACRYSDIIKTPFNNTSAYYDDFSAVSLTTNNVDGNTISFTYYVYENLAGKNSASTTWKDRNKINTSGLNVSYLTVDAHSSIWKSRYYIYLGGTNLISSGASPTYDYTDYNIYRNTNYTVTVNITGSGSSEDGLRVDYDANIYFSAPGINQWTNNPIDVSM